jgi:hypothetical protein
MARILHNTNKSKQEKSLKSYYKLVNGSRYINHKTELPHHTNLYANHCNDRQRVIINRIRAFEDRGYQGICKTEDDWWVDEYLPTQMINVCKRTFQRDLEHLEKIGLIRRNTWSKHEHVGGSKRIIYTAWGLESYEKHFLLYTGKNPDIDYKVKPFKVFQQYHDFKKQVEKLNNDFWKEEDEETQAIIDQEVKIPAVENVVRISEFTPSGYNSDILYISRAKAPRSFRILKTKEELKRWLQDPSSSGTNVKWTSEALKGLEKEWHLVMLLRIADSQTRFGSSRGDREQYLLWLYCTIEQLAIDGKIPMPENMLLYVLKCHGWRKYAQWQESRHAEKLERGRNPSCPLKEIYTLSNDCINRVIDFANEVGFVVDGRYLWIDDVTWTYIDESDVLKVISDWAKCNDRSDVLQLLMDRFQEFVRV